MCGNTHKKGKNIKDVITMDNPQPIPINKDAVQRLDVGGETKTNTTDLFLF